MPRPDQVPDHVLPPSDPAASRTLLPLQGITVLAVEDSRYASDALRLMCQRSGARLRRADSLAAAEAHLRCYRPDVAIIDLGLPDGRGEALIARLAQTQGVVVLAVSGDPAGRETALAAGATDFLEKPLAGLAAFQEAVLAHLPETRRSALPGTGVVEADPLALADDLLHAASLLEAAPDGGRRAYVAGFLSGLARQSQDAHLAAVSAALQDPGFEAGLLSLALRARISAAPGFVTAVPVPPAPQFPPACAPDGST
jgi:CheY-like chemotaxis protein